jgi:hypothetical protein
MRSSANQAAWPARVLAIVQRPAVTAALICAAASLVILPWAAAWLARPDYLRWLVGIDRDIYFSATQSWLSDGQWYLARQIQGPYGILYGDVLYPPVLLYLLVPFRELPSILWWVLPLGATLMALWRIRPPGWALPAVLLCLAWPLAIEQVIKGNPVIWILAAESVAIALGWPNTLVLLKPSLFPFALIGIHRRSWWLVLAILALASLPLWQLTLEYPAVVLDSRGGGLLYSVRDVPLLLMPVVAGLAAGRLRPTGIAPRWRRQARSPGSP